MQDSQFSKFEDDMRRVQRDMRKLEESLLSLHHSAKRAGSPNGYRKTLAKIQSLTKFMEDASRDYSKASTEHKHLLSQGKDNEKDQTYNYSKVDLSRLPIKKNVGRLGD